MFNKQWLTIEERYGGIVKVYLSFIVMGFNFLPGFIFKRKFVTCVVVSGLTEQVKAWQVVVKSQWNGKMGYALNLFLYIEYALICVSLWDTYSLF